MDDEPHDDALDLCRGLCARAGMMFEDISDGVIATGKLDRRHLLAVIENARSVSGKAALLLAAVAAIVEECDDWEGC
jgi:hypothetical protein